MRPTRVFAALALAAMLLPTAAAAVALPDLSGDDLNVGPCSVRWSWFWPGESLGVTCTHEGETLVAVSHGTCSLGHYTYAEAAGRSVYLPCNASWLVLA